MTSLPWTGKDRGNAPPAPAGRGLRTELAPALAILLGAAIFLVDTLTPLDMAIAVLYVAVIMLLANHLTRSGILAVGGICIALAMVSFVIMHGHGYDPEAIARCGVSVAAIVVTSLLSWKNQKVNESLKSQAALLDLTHDAILVRNTNETILFWNRGAEELYGWSREEALGQNILALLRTVFPKDLPAITAEVLETGRWEGELRHTRKDGSHVVVNSRWSLQRDARGRPVATMATNTDITARKQSEESLNTARAELRRAIDAIPGMVWSASADDGALLFVNARWADVGWKADELAGPDWWTVAHPDDRPHVQEQWQKALAAGHPFECTVRLRDGEGGYRWMLVQCTPLRDEAGRIVRWYGINTDIEDRRRAEDALHQAQAELAHMTRITTLGELTASIAHEVNQPLAAIATNGDACLRWLRRPEPDVAEAVASVQRIIASGRRASDVIARLRALSRRSDPSYVPVQLNEIIEETLLLVEREVFSHRIDLHLELAAGLPEVKGDRVQLQQVLINLVVNAIQAMETVPAEARRLVISSGSEPGTGDAGGHDAVNHDEGGLDAEPGAAGWATIMVRDSGVGVDEAHLGLLFNAFYSTKSDGMGMGLSISRSIVEAHAGRISATPNAEGGLTFSIRLPVAKETVP